MKTEIKKLPKSTYQIEVTIENDAVRKSYEKIFNKLVAELELPGFRKGMAPKEMAKEKLDTSKVYGDIVNDLLQTYYPQALKENLITPVSNPKVEIKEFDLDKDFEFTATVASRPEVKIPNDYKEKLKKLSEERKAKLKEENAKNLAEGKELSTAHDHLHTNDIVEALIDMAEVEISELLTEEESQRMMSRLVDQAQSINLSLEQYLKSVNKNSEELMEDYKKAAENSLKAEFVLSHLVKEENIQVTDEEVKQAVEASGQGDAWERIKDSIEKYYIKGVIEKNKLLSQLLEAVEGEDPHKQD